MTKTLAVAIQGEAGSFSHAAAREALGPDVRLVPCPTFEDLFRAVEAGQATRGVVPIENSLAGSVYEAYDALGAHALHVVAETQVRVRHCLVVRPGTGLGALRRVASHPVALAQCEEFFKRHPRLTRTATYDTAGSVRLLREVPTLTLFDSLRCVSLTLWDERKRRLVPFAAAS